MTVWQDPDTDEAYLVFATDNNANLAIASLNSDYTNVTAILYNFTNVYWEGNRYEWPCRNFRHALIYVLDSAGCFQVRR